MSKGMRSADEQNLYEVFNEACEAFRAENLEDAKAGLELFKEELHTGDGIYSWWFYSQSNFAAAWLAEAIEEAETETKQGVA